MERVLPAPAATDLLGEQLAQSIPGSVVVYLVGDLGAGKSTLARALLRSLGVAGTIKSPTYTLVERYPLADGEAVHLDLYRVAAAGELEFLGLDELRGQARLWLVEWPERGGSALPPPDLRISLAVRGDGRQADLVASTAMGQAWLAALSKNAAPGGSS